MKNIDDQIEFVKGQSAFHERQVDRFSDDAKRSSLHAITAEKFRTLAADLEKMKRRFSSAHLDSSEVAAAKLSLSWKEIEDLPDELMAELSISESDKADFTIVGLIDENGGLASIDQILIALYRKTGEISKRLALNSRLYRMVQKRLIFSVSGKKGVYSTQPIVEDSATETE